MKIIVDEMPKLAEDCVFVTEEKIRCKIKDGGLCLDPCKCEYLKPITECYAKETIDEHWARKIPIECERKG